jgi:asparagine synthase (glutamine-hydrolysing)
MTTGWVCFAGCVAEVEAVDRRLVHVATHLKLRLSHGCRIAVSPRAAIVGMRFGAAGATVAEGQPPQRETAWTIPEVGLSRRSGAAELHASAKWFDVDAVYEVSSPARTLFCSDLRVAALLAGVTDLDEIGVTGLLTVGSAPAPYTVFSGVARIPPGSEVLARIEGSGLVRRTFSASPWSAPEHPPRPLGQQFLDLIDTQLEHDGVAALSFSGGIDSTLLAARLIRRVPDSALVGIYFDEGDAQQRRIDVVGRALGALPVVSRFDPAYVDRVLDAPYQEYERPFADFSSPCSLQVAELGRLTVGPGGVLYDGVGADGAFATSIADWRAVIALPKLVRALLHRVGTTRLRFLRAPHRYGAALRAIAKSATFSPTVAAIAAQHALAYEYLLEPVKPVRAVDRALQAFIVGIHDNDIAASILDVQQVCSDVYAQKSTTPAANRGLQSRTPFLSQDVVAFGVHLPPDERRSGGLGKPWLRRLVAEHLGEEAAFLPKTGFTPPQDVIFETPSFRDTLQWATADPASPLREYVQPKLGHFLGRRSLSVEHRNLLWAVAVGARWLAGALEASTVLPGDDRHRPPLVKELEAVQAEKGVAGL